MGCALAEPEADADAYYGYGGYGLGYRSYGGYGLGYSGLYGGYGLGYAARPYGYSTLGYRGHYIGKREAEPEAEPEADADAYYGWGGYGLGYRSYGRYGLGYSGLYGGYGLGYAARPYGYSTLDTVATTSARERLRLSLRLMPMPTMAGEAMA